ncbi:hypothetical protein F4824DRAFT_453295 [Ustulina deusta]|nr:hypothetical protein F4824DRAFT_453295 [Ustulina deusta]
MLYEAANNKWPALKSLALTSVLLHPDSPRRTITDLLQAAAANAAIQMPSLRLVEIWNYDKDLDFVYIFQYRRVGDNGYPIITISNTWGVAPLGFATSLGVPAHMGGRDG